MKLLTKKESEDSLKKENDVLLVENLRLKKEHRDLILILNNTKSNYSEDKIRALNDFNTFSQDLFEKKSVLLKENNDLLNAIEQKKELYYGLVEKADELKEKEYQLNEWEKKLDLRENFIKQLEVKQYAN